MLKARSIASRPLNFSSGTVHSYGAFARPRSLWARQSVGVVSGLQSAGAIVSEIADEARLLLQRLAQ
jgi:hypothetical protein